jgi:AcrR family transcriptional regulator
MNHIAERRQEEKDRRRDQILDAAAAIAEQHGVAAFTMDQVAKKARLSRALIYVYFQDKDELLFGLADRAHIALCERFTAITHKKQTGLKMLQDMGRAYVAYAIEFPAYFDAMACFAAHETLIDEQDENEARCMQACDQVMAVLVHALKTGIADGSMRRDMGAPEMVAITLWGMMYGIIQLIAAKEAVLKYLGASSQQLVESALQLATRALATPTASTRKSKQSIK